MITTLVIYTVMTAAEEKNRESLHSHIFGNQLYENIFRQ